MVNHSICSFALSELWMLHMLKRGSMDGEKANSPDRTNELLHTTGAIHNNLSARIDISLCIQKI
jgi:hypothetical protein